MKNLKLIKFDLNYFQSIAGQDDNWIAIGMDNCFNQKYYIVQDEDSNKIGIVGMYDTNDEKNLTHILIDPNYRGLGLLKEFYKLLRQKENPVYLIATIDIKNISSIKSHEKAGFRKISNEKYEKDFHKFKYKYFNKKG